MDNLSSDALDGLFKWAVNNGIGTVFSLLLLWMGVRAINNLTAVISKLQVTAEGNNQALRDIMLFVAQNMQQVVAHRQAIEGEDAPAKVPGTTMTGEVPGQ